MEAALQHVFFAAVDQLDRYAGHFLGDGDGLAHVVGHAASAKTAAQVHFVDITLRLRQTCHFGSGRQRRFAILRGCPDFTTLRRIPRGGVHGFHAGVVLVRVAVNGFNLFGGACHRGFHVAILVAHGGFGRVQRGAHHLGEFNARLFFVVTIVPFDGQGR